MPLRTERFFADTAISSLPSAPPLTRRSRLCLADTCSAHLGPSTSLPRSKAPLPTRLNLMTLTMLPRMLSNDACAPPSHVAAHPPILAGGVVAWLLLQHVPEVSRRQAEVLEKRVGALAAPCRPNSVVGGPGRAETKTCSYCWSEHGLWISRPPNAFMIWGYPP